MQSSAIGSTDRFLFLRKLGHILLVMALLEEIWPISSLAPEVFFFSFSNPSLIYICVRSYFLHAPHCSRPFWWRWQQVVPERLYDIAGRTSVTPPYGNITLDYVLEMGSVGDNHPIRDVMDTGVEPLCYVYV